MKIKNFQINNSERQLKLAGLVGLLLTDGGVSCVSGKWRVHYTSKSKVLINEFKNLMRDLYQKNVCPEKRFGAITVRCWIDGNIRNELLSLSPTYRTTMCNHFPICPKIKGKNYKPCKECLPKDNYPQAKIPKFISQNKSFAREFLKYAITADGSVVFYIGKAKYGFRFDRYIILCCKHSFLCKQYFRLFRNLGFKPKISKKGIVLRRKINLLKFSKEIGFVKGVEILQNKLWNGFDKSTLLRLSVYSFLLKPSELGDTKDKIYKKLLNILASGTGEVSI